MRTWQNTFETNLPVDLLLWVIRDGIIKPLALKTFLYIKLSYEDRFVLNPQLYHEISKGLKITEKTAHAHVKELIEINFIGIDPKTQVLFIRSKYKIIPADRIRTKYQVKVSIEHLFHFSEFILSATIAYLCRIKTMIAKYRSALKNEGAQQDRYAAIIKAYEGYPMSRNYLANFLDKHESWVQKYKHKAKKLGWVRVKHFWIETGIPWSQRLSYLKSTGIATGRAKKSKGKLMLIGTDILASPIIVCRLWKKSNRTKNES